MVMVGFKNTNNQAVYVNPDQVLYVTAFEPDVTIITFPFSSPQGQNSLLHVRGSVELVQAKLSGMLPAKG